MERSKRKVRNGVVLSNKMQKTLVVSVDRLERDPLYHKVRKRTKKYYVHDEGAQTKNVGDRVTIVETRPLSKLKRWRVVEA